MKNKTEYTWEDIVKHADSIKLTMVLYNNYDNDYRENFVEIGRPGGKKYLWYINITNSFSDSRIVPYYPIYVIRFLTKFIRPFLPGLTQKQLIKIFHDHRTINLSRVSET